MSSAASSSPAWHHLTPEETARALECPLDGLASGEAERRAARVGPNELQDAGHRGPLAVLAGQVASVMVLLLVVSAAVSLAVGKRVEAVAIVGIVALFVVLGFVQEYRAERAIASLRRMAMPLARVRRDGREIAVSSRDLVPGDLVFLEAGSVVPADLRLMQCAGLRVQEAALTGESEPVEKDAGTLPGGEIPLADRRNLAHRGTLVTYGRGAGLVVATGMATELGRVARLIREAPAPRTPLQRKLDRLGRAAALAAVAAAVVVFAAGLALGESVRDMVVTAISVAVAAIPEGLPAVVTVTLALGARRMLRRHALIRSLPAAEALGSVTVICSDKTGTLTENRMTVTVVDVAGHRRDLVETLRHGEAALDTGEAGTAPGDAEEGVAMVLAAGALCSDAALVEGPSPGAFHAVGDPTEGALVVAAARSGMMRRDLESLWPRHGEAPFDSERKRMSTVHALPAAEAAARLRLPRSWAADPAAPGRESLVVTKGSVDGLVSLCTGVWSEGKVLPLDGSWQRRISGAANAMAGGGMRVLGFAFRRLAAEAAGGAPPALSLEHSLVFIGMAGLLDPPRAEARAAVELCRSAGIRPVMITGDHPLTALAIARDLGITDAGTGARAVTGSEIDAAPAGSLGDLAARAPVFARVSPEHKLRLVRALQTRGEVVAMTGDGVNDAPALRTADVGVAMGITGTDVARDASDIVLTDDNFASIVAAVEEGRVIVANIRRFVTFSMSGNLGKILLMLAAPLAGIPVALYPLQLLWLNLLTDGLLGLAMGFEPAEPGVMRRRPAPPRPGILSRASVLHIGWVGVLIALLALGTGVVARGLGIAEWRGTIFALLGFLQLWESFAVRSERVSVFHLPFTGNRVLLLLATLVAALQAAILGVPALGGLLGLPALSPPAILACAGLGSIVFLAMELEKLVTRRRAALHEPVAR